MPINDVEAIRGAVEHWERAWNIGDMSIATSMFTHDADFVNVLGSHWHGREQIESEHVKRHQAQLKGSTFTAREVKVQQLGPELGLVHVAWTIRGDHDLDGGSREPRHGLFTWVMVKESGERWCVRAAHNTHVATAPLGS